MNRAHNAVTAAVLALLAAGCGGGPEPTAPRALQEESLAARCAPQGEERVLLAWKEGRRYCVRYGPGGAIAYVEARAGS